MSKFKAGDRVRYTGNSSPWVKDFVGTVTGVSKGNVQGVWDNGDFWSGYYPGNLTLLPKTAPTPAIDAHYTKYAIQPMERQEGGSHYAGMAIQPVDYITKNGLDYLAGNVIKYISRHKEKGGAEDIRKAIHYCEMILERQYR